MDYRKAGMDECALLAELNHQLIQDEGHRNPMTIPELATRMQGWLASDYQAILFEDDGEVVAYALFREEKTSIYLRQFFVVRHRRRMGIGRKAMSLLLENIWPKDKRLLVEVLCQNTSAIAFWKSVGFQEYSLALEIMPRT